MSSYDDRNIVQIKLDEMIRKYKDRSRESGSMADRNESDAEIYKQIMSLIADLELLKITVDKVSLKGGKIGNKH